MPYGHQISWLNCVKAHSKAGHWRDTPFPLYDQCEFLIKGVIAMGADAFHPGQTPPSLPPHPDTTLSTATFSLSLPSQENSILNNKLSIQISSGLPSVSSLPYMLSTAYLIRYLIILRIRINLVKSNLPVLRKGYVQILRHPHLRIHHPINVHEKGTTTNVGWTCCLTWQVLLL